MAILTQFLPKKERWNLLKWIKVKELLFKKVKKITFTHFLSMIFSSLTKLNK